MNISKNIIDLPAPGMFASADLKVICWEGKNYYLACGAFVANLAEGGQSTCVKRVDHPNIMHEDFDGRTRTRRPEAEEELLKQVIDE